MRSGGVAEITSKTRDEQKQMRSLITDNSE